MDRSELILNKDGSVYHLKLKSENLSSKVILVGDPFRVDKITKHFDKIEFKTQNREFKSVTGYYKSKRITVVSTGIGSGNIEIVLNELDALVNINLETGEVYKDNIPYTTGSVTWTNDNSTIFYDKKDIETLREERVMKHSFETNTKNDEEIYFEDCETFSVYSYKTKSNKYIVIASQSTLSDEYLIINANDHNNKYKMFQKREKGLEHSITHFNDKWYIRTNKDNATNFKLMICDENKTSKEYWKDFMSI